MTELTKSPFPPFMQTAPTVTPTGATPTVVPEMETPKEAKPKKVKKVKKDGGERKTPNKAMTEDQIKQVITLVKEHSYTEIGEMLNISKHQVNRVLMDIKTKLRASATDDATKAKVEKIIKENLSRPEESRPGVSGPKGGKVKNVVNDIVGNILAGLV